MARAKIQTPRPPSFMDEVDELQTPVHLVSASTDDQSRELLIRLRALADDSPIATIYRSLGENRA